MLTNNTLIYNGGREQVEDNMERWRHALERGGMKVGMRGAQV